MLARVLVLPHQEFVPIQEFYVLLALILVIQIIQEYRVMDCQVIVLILQQI